MKTLEQVLEMMERHIDRHELEGYIQRDWIRPRREQEVWYFEEIDIARLELVCHLTQDIEINEQGMDVVLSLLDQLYGLRTNMKHLSDAIAQQQPQVQTEIKAILTKLKEA